MTSIHSQQPSQTAHTLTPQELLERKPRADPVTGTPIKYEYVDAPSTPSIVKRIVEKKVGVKEVVEDVIVEIPDITYQDVVKKVPRTKETAVTRPKKKIHERTVQEIRRVPKVVERPIKKRVEVKGEPKEIRVVNEIITHNPIDKYFDDERAVVVAQTVKPTTHMTDKIIEVPVARLTPKINYVDVHVAVPIKRNADFTILKDAHYHKPAHIPDAQFNSLLIAMNDHLNEDQMQDLPFKRGLRGEVNVCPEKMKAILLDHHEAAQLGVSTRQPMEIFPRGDRHANTPVSRPSMSSHTTQVAQENTKLMSGLSQLSHMEVTNKSHSSTKLRSDIHHQPSMTMKSVPAAPLH